MFRFYFGELDLLLRGEKGGNLRVGLPDSLQDALGRLASDDFHVGPGFFDQRLDLRRLLSGQVQAGLQSFKHVAR